MGFYLSALDNYERGVLPFPGSLSEQPARVIEILQTIKAIRNENAQREYEKEQMRLKRENSVRR